MVILVGLAAALATYLGGRLALRFRDRLHLITAFSAGAVLGVAFFDLLPESLQLASSTHSINYIATLIALGFTIFMLLSNWLLVHPHCDDCDTPNHKGRLGAASLSLHSLLDGLAIGLAFQVSATVGWVVTAAVLAHDFSDGINTVSLIIKNKGGTSEAKTWLLLDAIAPLAGVLIGQSFALSEATLGSVLAIFCGFFLFIGASDLLPESHHHHSKVPTVLATVAGMAVLYLAINFAGR